MASLLARNAITEAELTTASGVLAKAIPAHPGYFAGADGNVYSARWIGGHRPCNPKRVQIRQLKGNVDSRDYLCVYLYTEEKRVCCRVHVLVALAWHGKKPKKRIVIRHMNHDRYDNHPENLRYGTQSANMHDWQRSKWERERGPPTDTSSDCPF